MQTILQNTTQKQTSCLIIGGGISGLMAGTVLQRHGIEVTVLDKGRGIGGRLATRRISSPSYGEGVFDYGVQFFTVNSRKFQPWVDEWLQANVVGEWSRQFSEIDQPCYRGMGSNRSIAKHLAKDLTIHCQTRAISIHWGSSSWTVQTENGVYFEGDRLIITAPIPQSLALLEASGVILPSVLKYRLDQVRYQPCIAVLALLDRPSLIPEPGGLRLVDSSLAWLACNQQKGISSRGFAVTLLATPQFSDDHWEIDNSIVVEKLFKIAKPWLGATVVDYQVHRWRYSQPTVFYEADYLVVPQPEMLVLAGDGFLATPLGDVSSNLERAAVSGLEAANFILEG